MKQNTAEGFWSLWINDITASSVSRKLNNYIRVLEKAVIGK